MKLKLNKDGSAVVRNGAPVYVLDNGAEREIDGAAAWKLALGKHFETSPVMSSLKIPHDLATAAFSDSFRIEGGKLVAVDKHGIQLYSGTRFGEVANFDEAFAQLVDRYPSKDMILRQSGASSTAVSGGEQGTGNTITRSQFDSMPSASKAKFIKEGGKIVDGATEHSSSPAPARVNGKTITRAAFDVMPHMERAAFFKSGGTIDD
ncbi:DUF6651 domain-containing protein [Pseudoduganella violacea]|uniref:DUF6651 domain-containing protein n=1 Tax=Pseudoduganella violacea TaxID=1715466 RepID=A0A7W5B884_9BURK|nr:DUF6651 domain-containing protein [Pseudoduganella violacea]MBB3118366.1 hypothetical protein [Pseudoduganella violacea]